MIYPITWHVGEDATNDAGAQGDFAPPAKRGRARGANVKTSNESVTRAKLPKILEITSEAKAMFMMTMRTTPI